MTIEVEIQDRFPQTEMELGHESKFSEEEEEGEMKMKKSADDENSPRGVFEIPIMATDSDLSESSSGGDGNGDGGSPRAEEKLVEPEILLEETAEGGGNPWKAMIGSIKKKSVWRLSTFPLLAASYELSRRNFKRKLARIRSADDAININSDDLPFCKPSWRSYGFSELSDATNNFNPGAEPLEWKIRFKVAVGVAEGLHYLHCECPRRIIHRDIKASNILLDENYDPLISDFGLAKWLPENWAHHVVFPIEGTFGYLAPEYFMHGIVDEKVDVFAYGVLLLELITGRRAVDSSQQSLVIWAKPLLESNSFKELIDPKLGDDYDQTEMRRTMLAASMCINHSSPLRPHMNRVVQLLKGEDGQLDQLKQKSMDADRSPLLEACDLEEYTSNTNYLNDLSRHRELVLE